MVQSLIVNLIPEAIIAFSEGRYFHFHSELLELSAHTGLRKASLRRDQQSTSTSHYPLVPLLSKSDCNDCHKSPKDLYCSPIEKLVNILRQEGI